MPLNEYLLLIFLINIWILFIRFFFVLLSFFPCCCCFCYCLPSHPIQNIYKVSNTRGYCLLMYNEIVYVNSVFFLSLVNILWGFAGRILEKQLDFSLISNQYDELELNFTWRKIEVDRNWFLNWRMVNYQTYRTFRSLQCKFSERFWANFGRKVFVAYLF